jgi:hypothetical protein
MRILDPGLGPKTDRIDEIVEPVDSRRGGCPNTLGRKTGRHETRVFIATDKVHAEFNNRFHAEEIGCQYPNNPHHVNNAIPPGQPAPTFWNDPAILVDTGLFRWSLSWNCCCPRVPTQTLRWSPPGGSDSIL